MHSTREWLAPFGQLRSRRCHRAIVPAEVRGRVVFQGAVSDVVGAQVNCSMTTNLGGRAMRNRLLREFAGAMVIVLVSLAGVSSAQAQAPAGTPWGYITSMTAGWSADTMTIYLSSTT